MTEFSGSNHRNNEKCNPSNTDFSERDELAAIPSVFKSLGPRSIISLQRYLGNQAVTRLLRQSTQEPTLKTSASVSSHVQRALAWTAGKLDSDKRNVGGSFDTFRTILSELRRYEVAVQEWGADDYRLMPILKVIEHWCNRQLNDYATELRNGAVREVLADVQTEKERLLVAQLAQVRGLGGGELAKVRGAGKLPDRIPPALLPFLIQTLHEIAPNKNDPQGIMTQDEHPDNARGLRASLRHQYQRPKTANDQFRVIRFVKAARFSGGNPYGSVPFSATNGGYVSYGDTNEKIAKDDIVASRTSDQAGLDARKKIITGLANALNGGAKWCYDGPGKENNSTNINVLKNEDTPGQNTIFAQFKPTDYPYAIATEFIFVVYDEAQNTIIDVKEYTDCLAAWSQQDRKTALQPDQSLV